MTAVQILLAVLAGAIALPISRECLRRPVRRLRSRAGTVQIADLSQGLTRYRWFGPEGGPVVVMVHGLTSPSEVFDPLALTLAQHGFRVLSYDLYGRGLSDSPRTAQSGPHLVRQLKDLLADQTITQSVTFVGHSMGGTVASLFAATHPDRIAGLVLLAPAGMALRVSRFWRVARDWPGVGGWLARGAGDLDLRHGLASSGPLRAAQWTQLSRRGYLPAVLSSLRGVLSHPMEGTHRSLAQSSVPVLAIWGETDTVIPATAAGRLAQWNRLAEHEVLSRAGHMLPATHPEQVAALIVDFHARRIDGKSTPGDGAAPRI